MAGSVNKVILVGNLGKDPEVRSFQNGGRVAKFSIATSESWKDKNTGERKDKAEWHNVEIYSEQLIGIAEKYLRKGMKVYVEGQLETRKWADKDGNDRYTTSVVLKQFRGELTMLEGKNSSQGGSSDYAVADAGHTEMGGSLSNSGLSSNSGLGGGGASALDDDIPF